MKLLILFLFISLNISLQAQVEEWVGLNFNYTEKMPEFEGGSEEMYKFIYKNIRSTIPCQQESVNTQVKVEFIVDTTGYIVNLKVVGNDKSGCNDEALRVVNLMNEGYPHWSSGVQNGRKVKVTYTLPIMFNRK